MEDKELIEKAMDLAKQLDLARSTNYADTILELVKRIEELQPAPKSIVWEPKNGEKYWYVGRDGTGEFLYWGGDHVDMDFLEHHNVYKTQVQAEKAAKYRQRYNMVLQAVLNLEPEQVVDWKDKNQFKYLVAFDHRSGAWEYTDRLSIESGYPVLMNSLNVQPLLDYLNAKEKSDD